MLRNLIILLIALTGSATCYAWVTVSEIPHFGIAKIKKNGLTKRQAQSLLVFSLKHEKYNMLLPGVFIDDDLRPSGPYYHEMSVGYDTPAAGAIEYWGLFSISPKTGDIWEEYSCERISFPELKNIQTEIMKKTGVTFSDEKVQRRGLGCTDE